MSSHRGHQKKLEKKKKQRLAARAATRTPTGATSINGILRAAAVAPFGPSFMSGSWRSEEPQLVTVIVTRELADGRVVAGMALVDRTCLGVKDGFARPLASRAELEDLLAGVGEAHGQDIEEVSVLEAQAVVYAAIDFARSLGFAPHRDFPESIFGPRPATLLETPLAHPERALYIPGPTDDVERVLAMIEPKGGLLLEA